MDKTSVKKVQDYQTKELLLQTKVGYEDRAQENQMHQNNDEQQTSPVDNLDKFKRFIEFHVIDPYQIWQGKRDMLYFIFVSKVQKKIGYKFNSDQINILRKMSLEGNIYFNDFKDQGIWNNDFKDSNLIYFSKIISMKGKGNRKLNHRDSQKSKDSRIISYQKSQKSIQSRQLGSELHLRKEARKEKKKGQFQRSHFFKSWVGEATDDIKTSKIECLSKNLEMNQLQKRWQLVVMAGEMNKWIQNTSSAKENQEMRLVQFKILNKKSQFQIVKIDDKGLIQVIPEVVFNKKYFAMKKKQQRHKELNPNQAALQMLNMVSKESKGKLIGISKQTNRQKELNQTLLHIMRIKNVLQHQYKILSECAINT